MACWFCRSACQPFLLGLYANGATPETYRALDEIRFALQLSPDDAKVQEIAQNISFMFPDGISKNETGTTSPADANPHPPSARPTIAPAYDPAVVAGHIRAICSRLQTITRPVDTNIGERSLCHTGKQGR